MENLIPVLVILGVIGFVAWKNKDKILKLKDKWDDEPEIPKAPVSEPQTVVEPAKPTAVDAPRPEPVVEPAKVEPAPQEKPHAMTVVDHMVAMTPEQIAYKDSLVAKDARRKTQDYFKQFPKKFPNVLLGETRQTSSIPTLGPDPQSFSIFVPEGWAGKALITAIGFPGKEVEADTTITLKDWEGRTVHESTKSLEGNKLRLSGVAAKGCVKVDRGTYTFTITATREAPAFFHVVES